MVVGVATQAVSRVGACEADGGFGVAADQVVDRPGEDRAAGGFDAVDQFLGLLPFGGHVELIPGRRAESFDDVSDRGGGIGGEKLDGLLGFGSAGRGKFRLGRKARWLLTALA